MPLSGINNDSNHDSRSEGTKPGKNFSPLPVITYIFGDAWRKESYIRLSMKAISPIYAMQPKNEGDGAGYLMEPLIWLAIQTPRHGIANHESQAGAQCLQ